MLRITLSLPPSVNHCYRNVMRNGKISRALSREASDWKKQAGWLALAEAKSKKWNCLPVGVKVVMELYVYWPDERKRDMNNLHKLLPDALEGIIFENDQYVLIRDMDFTVDRKHPRVECVIYPKEV